MKNTKIRLFLTSVIGNNLSTETSSYHDTIYIARVQ